jgi:hypothetical protein
MKLFFWVLRRQTGIQGTTFNLQEGRKMKRKRQLHDGIAGALITAGVALGYYVNPGWLLLPGILGVTLLQSGFTGFCPVYYILDRTCPTE